MSIHPGAGKPAKLDTLVNIPKLVSAYYLNAEEALTRLDNEKVRNDVRNKQDYWKNLGVNSVPTIVFNRKSAITGAQPVDVFKEVLSEFITK